MDKNIGKKLDGRYEITELIGVGGMAEVYKGIDVIDNKTVAIKILKKEFAENEEFLRRFRNESKAIAVLSHPNIVKIYDVGFSEKIQYIVMEYIDGITLKEYIEEEKVLTWKDTVHFVIQILRALQHAHDKGIVHRDIKPQNIMMFTDGTIKVMDFGIAKFASEQGKTATDQAIGSVHYISPEQASGSVTDAKSDIYSVGAMMYEMLTGRKPFDSDNPVAIAVMHMHDIPERPRALNPDIPDGLEEIVLRAMEKAPEDRYQSTGEMIADIEAFKANPSITFGYYTEDTGDSDDSFISDGYGNDVETESPEEVQNAYAAKTPAYAGAGAGAMAMGGGRSAKRYADETPADYLDDEYYDDDYDDDEEEEERSSLVVPVLTGIVIVVLVVAVIFVATILSGLLKGGGKPADFTMPDFYGWDYNIAVSQYGNNIKFEVESSEYNEADENSIIEQSIEPGAEFNKGDTLKVKISKGMETVEIPRLRDLNQELAKAQLKERGLECEVIKTSDAEVQQGYVIKSEPDEGTEVHKGTKVVLYVSMGANAEQVVVEDYTGRTADDAVVMASYKGLKPRTEPVPSYEKEGTVVDQEPKKDEKVESGTEIVLYVSNGTTPDGEIPFTVYFPEGANGRFAIDFILKSADGKTDTVSSPTLLVPEMSSHTQNVKGSGENVNVTVVLTNLSTNQRANIGTYTFNFATNSVTKNSEDVEGAFRAVGGFTDQPATEAPQEQPQETPQEQPQDQTQEQQTQENIVHAERQEWVTGYYDESGNWIWYPGYGD
ncbi:MAG: Serine/threonine-protein kinase PrkC [Firmicutes bacterium ADurb.BinA205]|nr:MAG: Serine/threonine-protein kinase PrkC [Firmicutes bacterium ADurb.BinA205]HQL98968.1 Stk1 family PASTA domain-containing Ser/Thr kinase [Ruminococcus flavefaciens]